MAIQVAFPGFAIYIYSLHIMKIAEKKAVRLHLTNIAGLGAIRLVESLLPSFLQSPRHKIEDIHLPSHDKFSQILKGHNKSKLIPYKRFLPNSISRVLECTIFGSKFDGATPLLVLGDIPIRCQTKQTVFIQTSLLVQNARALKYFIAKWLFRLNMKYASAFIVQTEVMKSELIKTYPEIKGRVHVIAQPAPAWLISSKLKRIEPSHKTNSALRLFYPAALYPHKNHKLLSGIKKTSWPISELILTIPENQHPNPTCSWIKCVDNLTPDQVLENYENTDALLFLSLTESFGFPLVEAMWIGLPIICPDLPYARTLCGDQAIYFNPEQIESLHAAILELANRLESGWWPNWSKELSDIPLSWNETAAQMLGVATK